MLDMAVLKLLEAIAQDPVIQENRPEYVQAARELLIDNEIELNDRADRALIKAHGKGCGTA